MTIKPLRHCCNIAPIPTNFFNDLSYLQQLCGISDKVNEIIVAINNSFSDMIREQLDKLFIDAMYDEETETLILRLGVREDA